MKKIIFVLLVFLCTDCFANEFTIISEDDDSALYLDITSISNSNNISSFILYEEYYGEPLKLNAMPFPKVNVIQIEMQIDCIRKLKNTVSEKAFFNDKFISNNRYLTKQFETFKSDLGNKIHRIVCK